MFKKLGSGSATIRQTKSMQIILKHDWLDWFMDLNNIKSFGPSISPKSRKRFHNYMYRPRHHNTPAFFMRVCKFSQLLRVSTN